MADQSPSRPLNSQPSADHAQFELKPIARDAIPAALEKAERYRLLNEPREAESICRDILRADPDNQRAITTLILTLTDQFGRGFKVSVSHAQELLPRLTGEYDRAYFAGVICERWAKSQMAEGAPGYASYQWLRTAMDWFEKAEPLRATGNEDPILRWNTCARMIRRNEELRPKPQDESFGADFDNEVPV
jgi:hypothetical protein